MVGSTDTRITERRVLASLVLTKNPEARKLYRVSQSQS